MPAIVKHTLNPSCLSCAIFFTGWITLLTKQCQSTVVSSSLSSSLCHL